MGGPSPMWEGRKSGEEQIKERTDIYHTCKLHRGIKAGAKYVKGRQVSLQRVDHACNRSGSNKMFDNDFRHLTSTVFPVSPPFLFLP